MGRQYALETMVDGGVIVENGDEFGVAEAFLDLSEARVDAVTGLDGDDLVDAVTGFVGDEDRARTLVELCAGDAERLGRAIALAEQLPDAAFEDRLRMLVALDGFFREPPRDDGAPAAFLPASPDQLPFLLRLSHLAVVYVWRDDCDPCDLMKAEFDDLLPEPPDDVTTLAVFGPADTDLLREEYGVLGGPTTLFVVDGEVDLRLQGAQYGDVLADEVEKLRRIGG